MRNRVASGTASYTTSTTGIFSVGHPGLMRRNASSMCSSLLVLPQEFTETPLQSSPEDVQELAAYNKEKTAELKRKYPYVLSRHFNGEMVYTHRNIAPEEWIERGGFKQIPELHYQINTGNSEGSVCMTVGGAGIAGIFTRDNYHQRHFIYAFPLHGEYILPGSQWREVIAPGALAKPSFWLAREILDLNNNGRIELGPLVGQRGKLAVIPGYSFHEFCHERFITMPKKIDCGEDFPYEYLIEDKPDVVEFQKMVTKHYDEQKRQLMAEARPGMRI